MKEQAVPRKRIRHIGYLIFPCASYLCSLGIPSTQYIQQFCLSRHCRGKSRMLTWETAENKRLCIPTSGCYQLCEGALKSVICNLSRSKHLSGMEKNPSQFHDPFRPKQTILTTQFKLKILSGAQAILWRYFFSLKHSQVSGTVFYCQTLFKLEHSPLCLYFVLQFQH